MKTKTTSQIWWLVLFWVVVKPINQVKTEEMNEPGQRQGEIPIKHPADPGRGWTGFNGGDPYSVSTDTSKPFVIGATQSMITGLVCITPAEALDIRCGARMGSNIDGNGVRKHPMVHHDGPTQEGMVSEAKSMTRLRCSTHTP
ncbi:hypothetical protein V6N11_006661 [Hibiscus sabdariffa]|uniref:Uncharacterized protein n=1 Tax=Hibiscus sabdariffa TaxID=183260 RepID=A0ABR2RS28_9ROSI